MTGRRWHTLVALCIGAALLTGCRLDVVAVVDIGQDGSAEVVLGAVLDRELLEELDRLGTDPTAELAAIDDPAWSIGRRRVDDGAVKVTASREVAVEDVGDTLRAVSSALGRHDPALDIDLEVRRVGGGVRVEGVGGIRPPSDAGVAVDGVPLGISGAELQERVADAVSAELVVHTPGPVVSHDGEERADGGVAWRLPVGDVTDVTLAAEPPGPAWPRAASIVVAGIAAAAAIGVVLRRRRARTR